MSDNAALVKDLLFFFAESTLQSALLCVLVYAAERLLRIRHPSLRSDLWLLVLTVPVAVPLACHIMLPYSGLALTHKLLEQVLSAPIGYLAGRATALYLVVGGLGSLLFVQDVLRWALCWLRGRSGQALAGRHPEQVERCVAAFNQLGRPLGLLKLPGLLLLPGDRAEVYGLRWPRPAIHLSAELAAKLDDDELAAMLGHELAHLRRREWARLLAAQLCRDLMFFNPLAHLAYARFLQATEEAADDLAVLATRDRLALASCLLKVQTLVVARPAVVAAHFVYHPTNLARRVERLTNGEAAQPCPRLHQGVAWSLAGVAVLLAGMI